PPTPLGRAWYKIQKHRPYSVQQQRWAVFFMRILSSFPWRRAAALFCACLVCTALWAEAAQGRLADQVIRLHVLANSDSQADQALKLHVRDRVLEETQRLLAPAQDAAEAAD